MEVVAFSLELCRGVDLVGHDSGDCLLNILHPLGHLGVAHLVDLLNKLVIFLPERHLGRLFLVAGGVKNFLKKNIQISIL